MDWNREAGTRAQVEFQCLPFIGYPPIDIKFADRIPYYNAFDEYHVKYNPGAMEEEKIWQ